MSHSKLTRRRFLGLSAAVALAPAAARTPLAAASVGAPRATSFSMSLPELAHGGSSASWRWHTSQVLRAPARFDLVGLRWSDRKRPRVELRTRVRSSSWSPWMALPLAHHAPDGASPVRGTEPAWTGGADELQLRFDRSVSNARVHFVNATGTISALGRARAAARRATYAVRRALTETGGSDSAAPSIIKRSEWGGDKLPSKAAPEYGTVKLAFVHHTVGTNDYGPDQSASIVLAVAKFHRDVNGWNDIGYNFLVDKYGQIFEGRAGGIDRAVIGAQAAGYNSVSTGIANLGTYSTIDQTEAGLSAVSALIAWKLALHGVPVVGTVTANGKSFQRISGHRDANATECPGDALYGQLERIRALAASGVGAPPPGALTLDTRQPRIVAGEATLLSGMLSLADGGTPAGATIELQVQHTDGYRTIAETRTGTAGRWSMRFKRSRNARVRARYRDPASGRHVYSRSLRIAVAPAITAAASRRHVRAPASVHVSGRTNPPKHVVEILIERRGSSGTFSRVATVQAPTRAGRFQRAVRLARPGLHRITVRTPSDPRNAAGRAAPIIVRVAARTRRGAS